MKSKVWCTLPGCFLRNLDPLRVWLHLLDHEFGVLVHGFHEGADVLRLHVGVEAVAQVGDVASGAEARHHLLHDVGNPLLVEEKMRTT